VVIERLRKAGQRQLGKLLQEHSGFILLGIRLAAEPGFS
jgi:hypothetical protein